MWSYVTASPRRATPSSTTSYASHDQGDVEIVVYNRAILLFTTDGEAVRRIHQVSSIARMWDGPPHHQARTNMAMKVS